jgi:hypothetical protein
MGQSQVVDSRPVDDGYNPTKQHFVKLEDDPYFQPPMVEVDEGDADGDVEAEFEGDADDEDDGMDDD